MRLPPVLLPSAFHRLAGVLGISLVSLLSLGGCVTTPKQTEGRAFESRYEGFQYCGIDAVRQSRQASCGAAALTSVLNYWKEEEGVRYTEPELIKKYPAKSSEGYPILQLREMAMYEGIAAFALTMDTNSWEQLSDHVLALSVRLNLIHLDRSEGNAELADKLRMELNNAARSLPEDVLLYELAKTLESQDQGDEAAELYQRILDDHPASPYAAVARRATAS